LHCPQAPQVVAVGVKLFCVWVEHYGGPSVDQRMEASFRVSKHLHTVVVVVVLAVLNYLGAGAVLALAVGVVADVVAVGVVADVVAVVVVADVVAVGVVAAVVAVVVAADAVGVAVVAVMVAAFDVVERAIVVEAAVGVLGNAVAVAVVAVGLVGPGAAASAAAAAVVRGGGAVVVVVAAVNAELAVVVTVAAVAAAAVAAAAVAAAAAAAAAAGSKLVVAAAVVNMHDRRAGFAESVHSDEPRHLHSQTAAGVDPASHTGVVLASPVVDNTVFDTLAIRQNPEGVGQDVPHWQPTGQVNYSFLKLLENGTLSVLRAPLALLAYRTPGVPRGDERDGALPAPQQPR